MMHTKSGAQGSSGMLTAADYSQLAQQADMQRAQAVLAGRHSPKTEELLRRGSPEEAGSDPRDVRRSAEPPNWSSPLARSANMMRASSSSAWRTARERPSTTRSWSFSSRTLTRTPWQVLREDSAFEPHTCTEWRICQTTYTMSNSVELEVNSVGPSTHSLAWTAGETAYFRKLDAEQSHFRTEMAAPTPAAHSTSASGRVVGTNSIRNTASTSIASFFFLEQHRPSVSGL